MFRESYDLGTIISAIITFVMLVFVIRFMLYMINRKRPTIQKPDWLDDERFDNDKRRKRK
ncbi:hypothetical protein LS72_008560 [Helicobacter apodemus]|uniref:Uncharacterized protein n=1 Tax=Helicobacter apodemus TaxID=135569 RepID=A0A099U8G7_9HELI|nr:hypothetical protein [Helicobacter apodemus]AWI33672.1 hypothetical protein CDV25_02015 [Helicobacter apodemus]TLE14542.1 hypothetical protein LS72_008560 [Helicobacter apodemus]